MAAGVALGTVNVLANASLLGPWSGHLSKIVGNDWAWLVACFLAALTGTTWRSSFGRGLAMLFPAVVTYYVAELAVDDVLFGPAFADPYVLTNTVAWLVIATFTAAGVGLLTELVRRGGPVGVLAAAVVPGYIAWTAFTMQQWLDQPEPVDPALLDVVRVLWPAATIVTIVVLLVTGNRELRRRGARDVSETG